MERTQDELTRIMQLDLDNGQNSRQQRSAVLRTPLNRSNVYGSAERQNIVNTPLHFCKLDAATRPRSVWPLDEGLSAISLFTPALCIALNGRSKRTLLPNDLAARRALKGRNSIAMGLDPSTKPPRDLRALKGRNSRPGSQPILDGATGGHYFALSGLRSAGILPTMGQDPSLCYFAPLGLCHRDQHILKFTPMPSKGKQVSQRTQLYDPG